MATTRIPPAGDPFSARSAPSTRHHRVDDRFLALLEEDFGIPTFALSCAFMGFPAEPKKSAIALCEWASRADDPGCALLAWARKNHRGTFRLDITGEGRS
jgi:hypothetical protein